MKKKIIITVLALLLISFAVYYVKNNNQPENNNMNEEKIVVETNEKKAASFLEALKENNYQKLSKDFAEQISIDLTEEEMIKLNKLIEETWGNMIELGSPEFPDFGEDKVVLDYRNSKFEKEENTFIRFVFNKENKLEQVYFDSPKLKETVKQ
jgi:uncharacterized protein YxeA